MRAVFDVLSATSIYRPSNFHGPNALLVLFMSHGLYFCINVIASSKRLQILLRGEEEEFS